MKLRSLILLAVQLLLVISIGAKYLYERTVCPRAWVRSEQFDPDLPLRGRYLALQLLVDACSLPRDRAHYTLGYGMNGEQNRPMSWTWNVSLASENGHLVPRLEDRPRASNDVQQLTLWPTHRCDRVPLRSSAEYFIPQGAAGLPTLKPGQELWVEVTIPPSGPPRPVRLALSSDAGFQPLRFE